MVSKLVEAPASCSSQLLSSTHRCVCDTALKRKGCSAVGDWMRMATLPRARSLGLGLPELVGRGVRVVFEKRRIESCHPCYCNAKEEEKKGGKPDLCSPGSG